MGKVFKAIIYLVSLLLFLFILAIILIVIFINPNDFKAPIIQQVQQHTDRQLIIHGDLSWTVFPVFGLKAQGISLSNAPGFTGNNFADINQAQISIAVKPLLKGDMQFGQLTLDGVVVHLMKNSQGMSNWQDLFSHSVGKNINQTDPIAITSPTASSPASYFKLSSATLSAINIENGQLTWDDAQKQQHFTWSDITLHSEDLALNKAFPFSLTMMLQGTGIPLPVPLSLQTQMTIDTQAHTVTLSHVNGVAANLTLQGNITLDQNFQPMQITGEMAVPLFNLQKFFKAFGKPINSVSLQTVGGRFHLIADSNIVKIQPLQLQIYQGQMDGSIIIDNRLAMPRWQINSKFSNINIAPLVQSLDKIIHLQITGIGSLEAVLTTEGDSARAVQQNLNGSGRFAINNGILHGIDISYYSNLADALANKTALSATNTNQTPFGNLTGTFNIDNGIVTNNDLSLTAPAMQVTGKGSANLVTQQINYALQLQRMTGGQTSQTRGPAIPILITGSFEHPKIRPDWSALVSTEAVQQIKEKVQQYAPQLSQTLQKGLNALFGK